ncbi:MAG: dienelactone hydrolase family protein [Acidobacteria bacterium]|nr:dienelactone hydrolase family protein [Acidobacteriota bacterium]
MHEDFGTPNTQEEKVESLLHLYIDGGLPRREMIQRLTRLVGGSAAAMATLETAGLAQVSPGACPAGIQVAENDPAIQWQDVTFPGDAGAVRGLLARPRNQTVAQPGIIVIHENRGLVEHIRDVTRRFAKAGFVALGIDLLSRQGGTAAFADDTARIAAYGRTLAPDRYNDIYSAIDYLKVQPMVVWDRIGAIGFCAGGGNVYYGAFWKMPLQAGISFYGSPPSPLPPAENLSFPLLNVFSETDRNQAARIPELVTAMVAARINFGLHLYKGTGHGFHNDTSPIYNPAAACDVWAKSLEFLNTHLRAPRPAA